VPCFAVQCSLVSSRPRRIKGRQHFACRPAPGAIGLPTTSSAASSAASSPPSPPTTTPAPPRCAPGPAPVAAAGRARASCSTRRASGRATSRAAITASLRCAPGAALVAAARGTLWCCVTCTAPCRCSTRRPTTASLRCAPGQAPVAAAGGTGTSSTFFRACRRSSRGSSALRVSSFRRVSTSSCCSWRTSASTTILRSTGSASLRCAPGKGPVTAAGGARSAPTPASTSGTSVGAGSVGAGARTRSSRVARRGGTQLPPRLLRLRRWPPAARSQHRRRTHSLPRPSCHPRRQRGAAPFLPAPRPRRRRSSHHHPCSSGRWTASVPASAGSEQRRRAGLRHPHRGRGTGPVLAACISVIWPGGRPAAATGAQGHPAAPGRLGGAHPEWPASSRRRGRYPGRLGGRRRPRRGTGAPRTATGDDAVLPHDLCRPDGRPPAASIPAEQPVRGL